MSAIAIVRSEDCIIIASDGAIYGKDARLLGFGSKVVLLPEASCVFAQRGTCGVAAALRSELHICRDFDSIINHAVDAYRRVHAEFASALPHLDISSSIALCGWSERAQRFNLYTVASHSRMMHIAAAEKSFPAFELCEMEDDLYVAPWPSRQSMQRFQIKLESNSVQEDSDLAMKLICAARVEEYQPSNQVDVPHHGVGGFLQLTQLRRHHIASSIVHEWLDVIGEPIDPSRVDSFPNWQDGAGPSLR